MVTRLRIFLDGCTRTSGWSTSIPSTTYQEFWYNLDLKPKLPQEKRGRSQRFVWYCLPDWVTHKCLLPSLHLWLYSMFSPAPKEKCKSWPVFQLFLTRLVSILFPSTLVLQCCSWWFGAGMIVSFFFCQQKPSLTEWGFILGKVVWSKRRIPFPCILMPSTISRRFFRRISDH